MHDSATDTENILKQLGELLRKESEQQQAFDYKSSHKVKRSSQNAIEKLLDESLRIIDNQDSQKGMKFSTKGKIKAASELLKEEKSILIKSYIKEKIESQVFAKKNNSQESRNEKFQKRKQEAIQKRKRQIEQQKLRRSRLAQGVREFDSNSKVRIPIHQIDTILHEQNPGSAYLLQVSPNNSKLLSSKSNEVRNPNLYIDQVYSTHSYQKHDFNSRALLNSKVETDPENEGFLEIKEEEENQEKFGEIYPNTQVANVAELLNKKPNLTKIFYHFLEKQIKINSLSSALNLFPQIFKQNASKKNKADEESRVYCWKTKPKRFATHHNKQKLPTNSVKISTVTQKYKLKGTTLSESNKLSSSQGTPIICEKRINKMIGESKKYHPKKCILTQNQLIYFEQSEGQKQTKQIDLILQQIKIQSSSKEQGSFFSSKQLNNEIVLIQGKARLFKFEKNYLEGEQLYQEFVKLMANKAYLATCKIKGSWNESLYCFINDSKHKEFSLSDQFLQFAELYPNAQYRQLTLNTFVDLFEMRPNVEQLNLSASKVIPQELNQILLHCEKFKNLKKIDLSHTRVTKSSLQALCQSINSFLTNTEFVIILQDCKIDDQILNSNVGLFTTFTSKVKYLDLSRNNIGTKSLILLKNLLQNITCSIRHLILNDCPLRELSRLGNLIADAKRLQILEVKECFFDFENKNVEEIDDFFSNLKTTEIKMFNLQGNGKISTEKLAVLQKNWRSDAIERLYISLSLAPIEQAEDKEPKVVSLNFSIKR